jgi:serine/threonine protein phosphatase PrpC
VSASHVGRVRAANEDACAIVDLELGAAITGGTLGRIDAGEGGVLLAVSDGMGGARDGAVASKLTIEALTTELLHGSDEELEHATRSAHAAVWDASCRAGHHGPTRMGATLTAAVVRAMNVTVAQVGDSRAYLLREGEMTQLTRDQSVVQTLIDRGVLSPEEARCSPFKNILTQAMGHQEALTVAMSQCDLHDRDLLLLCSDGLTNELADDDIRDVVLHSIRLDVAAARLVDLANERGGRDNTTIVLAGVSGG